MDVNLECGCSDHPDQTHEEYMDQFDRRINKERWETSDKSKLAFYAFCIVEEQRLKSKLHYMQIGKIRSR